jgi:hypothetical protein
LSPIAPITILCPALYFFANWNISAEPETSNRREFMGKFAAFLLAAAIALPGATALAGEGTGTFTGASNHVTSGAVEVVKTADGWEVHLKDDFSLDGAPDARVGFGAAGKFAEATDFEPLRSLTGAQVYKVPADIDPTPYTEVYIWCRQYSVPLGVAQLTN